jgi:hypothetical protein
LTEIAPGMMVECIDDSEGWNFALTPAMLIVYKSLLKQIKIGEKYFVKECKQAANGQPAIELVGLISAYNNGWRISRFKPIGGDKEIEQQESKRTGKSAKGDMRNGDDHPNKIRFFIIDMDDK